MTTITAVRKNGQACIVADTLITFGDTTLPSKFNCAPDKIHVYKDNYLGIVGYAAHHIVIQSILDQHGDKLAFTSQMEIFESFRKLHPVLKKEYYLNPSPKSEDDEPYESSQINILIVNSHGIFAVHALREVYEYSRFWAVGSGEEIALGAMYTLYDHEENAEIIARKGVEAAAAFNNATALPVTVYNIELEV